MGHGRYHCNCKVTIMSYTLSFQTQIVVVKDVVDTLTLTDKDNDTMSCLALIDFAPTKHLYTKALGLG